MRRRYLCGAIGVLTTAAALTAVVSAAASPPATLAHSSMKLSKPSVMRTLNGKPARPGGGGGKNLFYHGGVGGIGVETVPKVYLVLWGSHWNIDPSGESATLQNFLGGVGGSGWLNSVTQYCQGIASGSSTCGTSGHAGNPTGILNGFWPDGSTAPSQPSQSDLAAEAVRAAAHFGKTVAGSNDSTQYVIATAHGNNASGFGTSYCAWHSSTSSSYGNIAYTNLPYITDAGTACGQDFNGLGSNAGITIVEGHELAETITDQFPNGGWLDRQGGENGDKCAWNSATSNQPMGGGPFPVQPLWSNASSSCVLSY
jgi:serine protease